MQRGAEEKQKTYAALVWCSRAHNTPAELAAAVDSSEAQLIAQGTPVRVMHRRALMTRERHVLRRRGQWISPHFFVLHLSTTAGAYVKEFIHGDLGRTTPSLADLIGSRVGEPSQGITCDIATLDVVDVAFKAESVGAADAAAAAAWGDDIPEVTEEAEEMVRAVHSGGCLMHHPILGMVVRPAAPQ
jgi:tRNA pseudouridine synthase 10